MPAFADLCRTLRRSGPPGSVTARPGRHGRAIASPRFMPNMPEAVIAMLAAASSGAIWSSCSPDFGTQGVVDRFSQIEPKILFAADGYLYEGRRFD